MPSYIPHPNAYETALVFDIYDVERTRQLKVCLRQMFLKIVFTKKSDGSQRILYGTTMDHYLPFQSREAMRKAEESGNKKPAPDGVIRVYDIEAEGWRSFLVSSFIEATRIHDPNLEEEALRRFEEMQIGESASLEYAAEMAS